MSASPSKPHGDRSTPRRSSTLALVLAIKILGVVGFVGLLAAAHYARGSEYQCRVAALLWFAFFGITYVLVSLKAPHGGRRWP